MSNRARADHDRRFGLLDDGRSLDLDGGFERVVVVDGSLDHLAQLLEIDGAVALERTGRDLTLDLGTADAACGPARPEPPGDRFDIGAVHGSAVEIAVELEEV